MGGLTAWQALLARAARPRRAGAGHGPRAGGHIAVQLRARRRSGRESGQSIWSSTLDGGDLRWRARGHDREEMPGAIYFIVEPDHEQLLELRTLVDAGELRAEESIGFRSRKPGRRSSESPREAWQVVLEVGATSRRLRRHLCRGCIELGACRPPRSRSSLIEGSGRRGPGGEPNARALVARLAEFDDPWQLLDVDRVPLLVPGDLHLYPARSSRLAGHRLVRSCDDAVKTES